METKIEKPIQFPSIGHLLKHEDVRVTMLIAIHPDTQLGRPSQQFPVLAFSYGEGHPPCQRDLAVQRIEMFNLLDNGPELAEIRNGLPGKRRQWMRGPIQSTAMSLHIARNRERGRESDWVGRIIDGMESVRVVKGGLRTRCEQHAE
jgi:hypothetical protein